MLDFRVSSFRSIPSGQAKLPMSTANEVSISSNIKFSRSICFQGASSHLRIGQPVNLWLCIMRFFARSVGYWLLIMSVTPTYQHVLETCELMIMVQMGHCECMVNEVVETKFVTFYANELVLYSSMKLSFGDFRSLLVIPDVDCYIVT